MEYKLEFLDRLAADVAEQLEIQIKYEGYISRQEDEIAKLKKNENFPLPIDLDYSIISGLSNEISQKLADVKPETIAQASRIPGVTPAAVSLLLVYLKKRQLIAKKKSA
jgi:tRNA uridine 5-carboxymethylaminomethyl modification enzyme